MTVVRSGVAVVSPVVLSRVVAMVKSLVWPVLALVVMILVIVRSVVALVKSVVDVVISVVAPVSSVMAAEKSVVVVVSSVLTVVNSVVAFNNLPGEAYFGEIILEGSCEFSNELNSKCCDISGGLCQVSGSFKVSGGRR